MNIKDRIAKLLALAESPNEHEAKAALLKARELMAEYKLRPEEISRSKDEKVIRRTTDITCTKMTNTWATRLSAIIASHYCCRAYRTHKKGAISNERLYRNISKADSRTAGYFSWLHSEYHPIWFCCKRNKYL